MIMDTAQSKKLDAESQLDSSTRDDSLLVVDPEMEKRVVRKIDKHLMPLIIGLCTYLPSISWNSREFELTSSKRSPGISRSFEYWQCENCWYGRGLASRI